MVKSVLFFIVGLCFTSEIASYPNQCSKAYKCEHKHYLGLFCPYLTWTTVPFLVIKIPTIYAMRNRIATDIRTIFSPEVLQAEQWYIGKTLFCDVAKKAFSLSLQQAILLTSCAYVGRYCLTGCVRSVCFMDTLNPACFVEIPLFVYNKIKGKNG